MMSFLPAYVHGLLQFRDGVHIPEFASPVALALLLPLLLWALLMVQKLHPPQL